METNSTGPAIPAAGSDTVRHRNRTTDITVSSPTRRGRVRFLFSDPPTRGMVLFTMMMFVALK
jgi:hypothetical protein